MCWQARLWVQVIHELRSGVRLKKTEYTRWAVIGPDQHPILTSDWSSGHPSSSSSRPTRFWWMTSDPRDTNLTRWIIVRAAVRIDICVSRRCFSDVDSNFTEIPACNDLSYHCEMLSDRTSRHGKHCLTPHSTIHETYFHLSLENIFSACSPDIFAQVTFPPRVKRDAHDVILDFIRSRPPLKPVSCEPLLLSSRHRAALLRLDADQGAIFLHISLKVTAKILYPLNFDGKFTVKLIQIEVLY